MVEKKDNRELPCTGEEGGQEKERTRRASGILWKFLLLIFAAAAAGGLYWHHYYNLPIQKLGRDLESAGELVLSGEYVSAAEAFSLAADDYEREAGYDREGLAVRAEELEMLLKRAEELGKKGDIPSRGEACAKLEEAVSLAEKFIENYHGLLREGDSAELSSAGLSAVSGAEGQASGAEGQASGAEGQASGAEGQASGAGGQTSGRSLAAILEDADSRLKNLRQEIAADYVQVEYELAVDDRSGTELSSDGTEPSFIWRYDLVKITDPWYPWAEKINFILERDRDAFFAGSGPGSGEEAFSSAESGILQKSVTAPHLDYVGVGGVYTGDGLLCIRMAHVQEIGQKRVNEYRGRVFRLSDAEEPTLAELAGRTETGLRRLLKRRIRSYLAEEGYTGISKEDVEDYVNKTDPGAFKYCIQDDGTLRLIIDQQVPFFSSADEILEIPLENPEK